MAQVNNYTTKSAYAADTSRLATESAISYIEENNETLFEGVNIVVNRQGAAEGDLVVWDSVTSSVRFVKAATLVKAELPDTLTPFAVVIGWRGDKVLIVSLRNLTMEDWNIGQATSASSIRWAHAYEVSLSGIDGTTAGTLTLSLTGEDVAVSWSAGTLATVASAITTACKAATTKTNQYWTAAVSGTNIILSHNYNTLATLTAVVGTGGGAGVAIAAQDDVDLQTTYAYLTTTEQIRRINGVNSYTAGANYAKFYDYYKTNGTAATGIGLRSSTILTEAAFTEADNPIVYAAYDGDYKAYLYGEHFVQYPSAYGTMTRDGKATTALLAPRLGTNVRGASEPQYPAAWLAANYDAEVEGFGAGEWWLPSADEAVQMMRYRRLNASDTSADAVNDTLVKMGGSTLYGNGFYCWTCCECNSYNAFIFNGNDGTMTSSSKYTRTSVRPLSAL